MVITPALWRPLVVPPPDQPGEARHPTSTTRAMDTTSRERNAAAALSESGSLLATDRIAGRGRVLLATSDCRAGDVLLVQSHHIGPLPVVRVL